MFTLRSMADGRVLVAAVEKAAPGNLSYLDLSLYLVVKSFARNASPDWDRELGQQAP